MAASISIVLNGYRRPANLKEQYHALKQQTVTPREVLLWYNNPEVVPPNWDIMAATTAAYCNKNLGVWARFAFALNAKSDFVCVFDDDTIPGPRWLENCLTTMNSHEGLLGTIGLLYTNPVAAEDPRCSYYENYVRFGWANPNETPVQVDLIGHAWFFKKSWLSTYWREQPAPEYTLCGEDMHFSYMLQKYSNIPTYVPPHPRNNADMWGSTKGLYGADQNSLWVSNKRDENKVAFRDSMNAFFVQQRKKGWRLINEPPVQPTT